MTYETASFPGEKFQSTVEKISGIAREIRDAGVNGVNVIQPDSLESEIYYTQEVASINWIEP